MSFTEQRKQANRVRDDILSTIRNLRAMERIIIEMAEVELRIWTAAADLVFEARQKLSELAGPPGSLERIAIADIINLVEDGEAKNIDPSLIFEAGKVIGMRDSFRKLFFATSDKFAYHQDNWNHRCRNGQSEV